jgi:hypothetical protein
MTAVDWLEIESTTFSFTSKQSKEKNWYRRRTMEVVLSKHLKLAALDTFLHLKGKWLQLVSLLRKLVKSSRAGLKIKYDSVE